MLNWAVGPRNTKPWPRLAIGALGIFLKALTGAKGYPKLPPGIPILAVIALPVYSTGRWTWTAVLGLVLVLLGWTGFLARRHAAARLQHPEDLSATLVQLTGMTLALVAGLLTVLARVRPRHRPGVA